MYAKDIMTTKVITASPKTTVSELIDLMVENNVSGVPVVDSKSQLIGIISENDLIYHQKLPVSPFLLCQYGSSRVKQMPNEYGDKLTALKVKDLMTSEVISVNADASIDKLTKLMVEKRLKSIPVTKNNKLIGIVNRKELLKEIFKLLLRT